MPTRTDDRRVYLMAQLGLTPDTARSLSQTDLERLFDALSTATPVGWTELTPIAGWSQSGPIVPAVRKDSQGYCFGRGVVSGGAGATGCAVTPAGMRPGAVTYFRWAVDNAGYIDTNGGIGAGFDHTGSAAAGRSLDLSFMCFKAAP